MIGGVYGSSKSGLQCKWGSDLDVHKPRPKPPKTALPNDVRAKLGLKKRNVVGRQSSVLNAEMAKSSGSHGIQKRSFLKKGTAQSERQAIPMHNQTLAWK